MSHHQSISSYWSQIDENRYENQVGQKDDVFLDCTLTPMGLYRNAQIKFSIEVLSVPQGFHAAVLFRKNGLQYLGAGLGGWASYYSLFHRTQDGGFIGLPRDREHKIQQGKTYHFEIEVQSGFVRSMTMNDETLFPSTISIRDSLGANLRNGHIGLYAYDQTRARIELTVTRRPTRCFIITNIDGKQGRCTDQRRQRFESIINDPEIEFLDSRDLSREHPLMSKIRQAIMESDAVLADFGLGDPRPNVYYETGIAHSVGVPIVHVGPRMKKLSCSIPSDMKAQFYILEEELDTKLPLTFKTILDANAESFDYLG